PAYVNIDKGVFLLHARIEYPNGPAIRSALRDGQTLTFDLDARVDRERRFWFSAGIVAVTLRRELSYHAVSQRFVVRDARSGDQESFATLDEALAYLGKVDAWGVIALSVLLARKLYRLVRDYRRHVPGSRLTARTVGIFGSLVIAPLLIVYLSSLEFINRGIDSWFRVEVKEALNDALGLSRAALADSGAGSDARFVVAIYPVPPQLGALTDAVQNAYHQYGDLAAWREPLKNSFSLTLTLVLLLAMLAAIYGAIFSAQRLVRPVQDLIEGTRAVGKGDFGTRLPLPSRDEMGFLVHSFNDMTKRLRRARAEATESQQAVERERERLAIILARLSTGVLAIDRNMTLRTANEAAGAILGADFSAAGGRSLPPLASGNERLGQFVA